MRSRTRIHLAASRIHKWLALVIGAQLLIWFASGMLMSFLPIEKVRGDHLVNRNRQQPIPHDVRLIEPTLLKVAAKQPVDSVTYRMLDGQPVAEAAVQGRMRLFDAVNGRALPSVDANTAIRVARSAWIGPRIPAAKASIVREESPEYRGSLPAWRVAFTDVDATSVFVAADTGRIGGVRTGTWRLYDFFWGLHIMDWRNHEDFNTPWLLAFAIGGLVLGLAGTVLLIMRWPIQRRRGRATIL